METYSIFVFVLNLGMVKSEFSITPGVCDKQVCYIGRRYVDLDLVHN